MPALFDLLYREYCRARLAEMRKQLLLMGSREVSEASCDAAHADRETDRHGDPEGTRHQADPGSLV